MMKHRLIVLALLALPMMMFSQNALDGNGLKTGPWKAYYENDVLKYEATFEAGEPVGIMTRYGTDGYISTSMNFYKDSDRCLVKMFSGAGTVEAEGVYVNRIKDSVWNYYGADGGLRMSENYVMGVLSGCSSSYYPSGKLSMLTTFNKGLKDGKWMRLFETGDTMMIADYKENKLHGSFRSYYPEEQLQAQGNYYEDLKDGDWNYYSEEGDLFTVLNYDKGEILNPDELEKSYEKFINNLDGVIEEFKEEDIIEKK